MAVGMQGSQDMAWELVWWAPCDGIGLVRCHKREAHTFPVNLLWSAVTQLWCLPKLVVCATLVAFVGCDQCGTVNLLILLTVSPTMECRYLGSNVH